MESLRHTIIHCLEIVYQSQDILMTHGDSFEHRDLISDLEVRLIISLDSPV